MRRVLLFVLFILSVCSQTVGQDLFRKVAWPDRIYPITSDKPIVIPIDYLELLEDRGGKMNFQEVSSGLYKEKFMPYTKMGREHQYTYWGRFAVHNQTHKFIEWKYYVGFNNFIKVYEKGGDVTDPIERKLGGQYMPSSLREIVEGRITAFNLSLQPGEIKVFYVRLQNINHRNVFFSPMLMPSTEWHKGVQQRNLLEGIFIGIMLIMVLYNFFIFLSNKDRTYLYYSAYILNITLYFFIIKGMSREFLFPEIPRMEAYGWTFALGISPYFYFQFMRSYLNTKELLPRWDRVIRTAARLMPFVVAIELFIILIDFNIELVGYIAILVLMIEALLSFVILVPLFQSRNKLAYYLAAGSLCLWAFGVAGMYFLLSSGFLLGLRYGQAGVVLEVLIFSLGLAYRMQAMQAEKEEAQHQLISQLQMNERLQLGYNKKLEDKVKERTNQLQDKNEKLELQNEEIKSQRDKLEHQKNEIEIRNQQLKAINDEKNHLISIVAHDLRNPLTSAISVSEWLSQKANELDDDHRSGVTLMRRSLNRMNDMITRILDLRAIEDQKLEIKWQVTDMTVLAETVVESLEEKAAKKDIALVFEGMEEDSRVNVDRDYLTQIIENLVSNALKFSSEGKKVVVKVEKKANNIRLLVKDEGPGISVADQKKLFQRFQKLGARPTGGETSTGIGLSIVKKYTEAMHGKVWCDSEEGMGACFIIEFEKWKPQKQVVTDQP